MITLTARLKTTRESEPNRSHNQPPDKLADTEPTTLLRVSPTEIQKLRIRGSAERVKHSTLPLKKSAKLIDCMAWPAYRGQMPSNR